jgi:hypothetical protein
MTDRRLKPRSEVVAARAELLAEGKIVRRLSADGKALMKENIRTGVPQQVWIPAEYATPEELDYWRRVDCPHLTS